MNKVLTGILVLALGAGSAAAEPMMDMTGQHAHEHAAAQAKPPQAVMHGRIENLGMAPMTMDYGVKDPSFLSLVKPGDKVKMTVEQVNWTYTIVALQRAP